MAGLPHVDSGAVLDAVDVRARFLVAVVAADQRLAGHDAVIVVELQSVAVRREERRTPGQLVVLLNGRETNKVKGSIYSYAMYEEERRLERLKIHTVVKIQDLTV